MLSSISQNNLEILVHDINQSKCERLVIVDYAADLNETLSFVKTTLPHINHVDYFCEYRPDTSALNIVRENTKPWSLKIYKKFLFADNPVSFEDHKPVYSGDISRLGAWRTKYMLRPFGRIVQKLDNLNICKKFTNIYTRLFCAAGLVTQLCVPPLRLKQGNIQANQQGLDINIYFNGSPEKDHYGECPLYQDSMDLFQNTVKTDDKNTAIIVVTGPRHLYVQSCLEIINQHKSNCLFIYACALYRPKTLKYFEDHNIGVFHKGSNISMNNMRVYSDHCLAIGAGERELWRYPASKD